MHYNFRQIMTNAINKTFLILKKKTITNVYHIIKLYIFIIYRIEPAFSKEKRSKMIKQIKIINALKKNKF